MATEDTENEAELRRRLSLLREQLAAGKIVFAPGLKVVESLSAVRADSDGKIDLATVDGAVRSLAMGAQFMHERDETKKIVPLAELQRGYFDFIERLLAGNLPRYAC